MQFSICGIEFEGYSLCLKIIKDKILLKVIVKIANTRYWISEFKVTLINSNFAFTEFNTSAAH